MAKHFWINLPVKDVNKSRDFFTQIGFTLNPHYGNGKDSASLMVGDQNVIVMLFPESTFAGFSSNTVTDTKQSTEVLFSIDAQSPAEVDEIAQKVEKAGGVVFGKPSSVQGWMYGCGFTDLDGHRWNVLHMDMSKMPKG
ncbi:extradiol dioxygenase [Solitalea sp. MAHUQ-68]|uniref:Extradiol dioxygenase n=1 Tax=Solitalea agri TaxID=2953739 RepID=A0A9X2F4X5_9SPHI|nr:VOC family protein [Solitalea agri]MCO4294777.1 extradiol dioxygenase [Solitalea agri]